MVSAPLGVRKPLIGVVHLLPLPGSPGWKGDMAAVLARARQDASALAEGGADGVIVENFGDAPFSVEPVGPHTVAAMTLAVQAVSETVQQPIGINVLRNDPYSALAIAIATGAGFVRSNVHYGVMVAEEGLIQGRACDTTRFRRSLGADDSAKILADVLVKHASPLGAPDLAQVARETVYRGLADALIVTGPSTGSPADPGDLATVKDAVPVVPVLVGSGLDEHNADAFLPLVDGAIVGTSLKVDGETRNPVDRERVERLARRFRAYR